MKKLLLTIMTIGSISSAFAAGSASTAPININATLAGSCAIAANSPAPITEMTSEKLSTLKSNVTLTCRKNTKYSLSATSDNNWNLRFKDGATDYDIPYTLNYDGTNPEGISANWSTGSIASNLIASSKDPVVYKVKVDITDTNSLSSVDLPAGSYQDNITITVNYS